MATTNPPLRITLNDYDWHQVGSPTEQFIVKAISGNALEMCCTGANEIPTAATKAFFWLGGQVNNVRTRPNYQNWIRATVIPSTYIQNPADQEGYDELSGIRMAIAELQRNVIGVSNRVLNVENWRGEAIRDWQLLQYQLNHRIDHMYKTLARLVEMDSKLMVDLYKVRMKIPTMITMINNLSNVIVTREDFEKQIEALLLTISKNMSINIETLKRLVALELDVIQVKEDIKILEQSGGTGGSIDTSKLTLLNTKVNALEENLNSYWEICTSMVAAKTETELTTLYDTYLATHQIPDDFKPALQFAYDQALKILQSTVIDATQTTDINDLNQMLDGVLVGEQMNAADLNNLSGS